MMTGAAAALGWLAERTGLGEFARAALTTLELFAVRLTVLAFSLPVFAVFVLAGLATGLSMRDIRRWSAGREFGGVHHVVRRLPGRVLTVGCFAYLRSVAIHPTRGAARRHCSGGVRAAAAAVQITLTYAGPARRRCGEHDWHAAAPATCWRLVAAPCSAALLCVAW